MINVLIKDGNRTVNWDYDENKFIGDILDENDFRPFPGTLTAGGKKVEFATSRLVDYPHEMTPDGKQKRVVITMKPMPEKKPAVKKGAVDSVR